MATLFHRDEPVDPALGESENAAYEKGRLDERRRLERETVAPVTARADEDRAYAAGRRDQRVRRRGGSPLLTLLLLVVVAIGAVMIYLAIQNGSFSAGGAVVDHSLSSAKNTVTAPVRGAADQAGDALQNAGANLKQKAGDGGS